MRWKKTINKGLRKSTATPKINSIMLMMAAFSATPSFAAVGKLIWQDNFDALNLSQWTVDVGDGCQYGASMCGWGNNELQWYSANNVSIRDVPGESGNKALVLEARREASNGKQFTSGKLTSQNKVSVQYGMIEIRMRTPNLQTGLWPAAWMLGSNTQPWPRKGEIDIMEQGHSLQARKDWRIFNSDPNDNSAWAPAINKFVGSNLIFYADGACNAGNPTCAASTAWQADNAYVAPTSLANRFVKYRLYWTSSSLRFAIEDNGVEHNMYENAFPISNEMAVFKSPFYMLLNLAVGGAFTDAQNPSQVTAPMAAPMYIDYVRVYELDGEGKVTTSNSTGGGTTTPTNPSTGTGPVQVFQHCNYTGWQANFGEGNHSSTALVAAGGQNNDASSLKIPVGYKVSLYDSDNLSGTPVVLTGDTACLVGNNFNDRLSSMKVEKTTTTPPTTSTYGIQPVGTSSIELYVNSNDWADVHFSINGGAQQNLRMTQSGGRNVYQIQGLKSGDRVSYHFTYWAGTFAIDTPVSVYTHAGDSSGGGSGGGDGGGSSGGTNGTGNGLAGSYFNGLNFETLAGARTDATLNMNWNNGSPMSGVNADRFSVRWRGQIEPRFTDNYTFHINSDNGRRVWIDGKLIIDRWVDDWNIEYTGNIALSAGRKYDIVVEYFENWGGANIKFEWSSPKQTREIVPQSQLYASATPPPPPPPPTQTAVTPLYNASTALEPNTQFDRGDALVTRFSDRPRTRHAREDQFQSYDHYIKFYFEHRSSNIEIVDYVAKGGDRIEMNVRTLWRLDDREAENRWWYLGRNTVAHYVGNGIMTYLGFDGIYHRYTKTDNLNRQFNREIRMGDRLEFEISQFSTPDIPRGQANYYGTTFLYIVGEGIVPWYTENAEEFVAGAADFQEDSRKIPESYWLGGKTTLHYQYTNEPNDHFMQMATNLGYNNGQKFLLGRRVHHSSAVDGMHDEDVANGSHSGMTGLSGTRYINERCTDCHKRNGSAPVAPDGELLDRWVFKVGDANGNPHPDLGRVLQPKGDSEGGASIAFWTENNGLRKPTYQFNGITPPTFSARIAPRLVGLGLLEAIPESTIIAKEDPADANGDGISGRANRVADPLNASVTRLGRFGWKAGTSSVKHQTAAALNTDMGVRSAVMPNPDCGANQRNCGTTSRMISNQHLDELVTYLSTLGVRPQRGIESGFVDQTINQGKQKFHDIGCASCHTETVQTSTFHPLAEVRNQTIHPYSDLLLHDMGPGLADNLGDANATGSEWRTTPLWGLGLSACVTGGVTNPTGREGDEVCTPHRAFLHDGRARTIDEAIRWHGGEGDASKRAYQALSATDKSAVLRFLEAL